MWLRSFLEDNAEQEKSLTAELQYVSQRTIEVNQELGEVMEELRNARLDSHESKRQQRRRELLEKLRRLFPETVVRTTNFTAFFFQTNAYK